MTSIEQSNERLLEELKELFALFLKFNTEAEEKAWNILRFTTATIGVGAGIGLFEGPLDNVATVGLAVAIGMYVLQVILVARLSEPLDVVKPPAIPDDSADMDAFFEDYYNTTHAELITPLIVDYAGTNNTDHKGAIAPHPIRK